MITQYRVTNKSYLVSPGGTFVAITGNNKCGNKFIAHALENGAQMIIVQSRSITDEIIAQCKKYNATLLESDNPRKEMAHRAAQAYDHPAKKLSIIGITGTKGKTTTTYLIRHILEKCGLKTALIGTICNSILDEHIQSTLTTPESDYLHAFFHECVQKKIDIVVMEVSAHGPAQYRIHDIPFSLIGFTNLMPDHLDYFKTMGSYFQAKLALFDYLIPQGIGFAFDDEWGTRIINYLKKKECAFISLSEKNAQKIELPTSNLIGNFNKKNIYLAAQICQSYGLSQENISQALKSFPGVPGRLQKYHLKNGSLGIIDFAHNGPATEHILTTLRPMTNQLIVVFGCGGDRDPSRRPAMGKAVAQYADIIIITSDNPRTEDPLKIIAEIQAGIPKEKFKNIYIIPDRREAIKKAAELSHESSIIAILGKGHETKQIIGNQEISFNDFEELSQL